MIKSALCEDIFFLKSTKAAADVGSDGYTSRLNRVPDAARQQSLAMNGILTFSDLRVRICSSALEEK